MMSYIAQIFDRFLFPGYNRSGCCFHQAPVGGSISATYQPDLYVSKLEKDGITPGDIVLLGEAKNHD